MTDYQPPLCIEETLDNGLTVEIRGLNPYVATICGLKVGVLAGVVYPETLLEMTKKEFGSESGFSNFKTKVLEAIAEKIALLKETQKKIDELSALNDSLALRSPPSQKAGT